jgi:tetratricopeptide (TPR) repeat protein
MTLPRPTSNTRDPVASFLQDKEVPIKKKVALTEVSLDLKGIQTLAENDCWKEVLKLCERCLQLGFAPHELLQYRLSQIVSLLRLHLNQFAQQNIDSLGDLSNSNVYFYEYYGTMYKNQKGNMVPYSLLLLKAVIPHFCNMDLEEQHGGQQEENSTNPYGRSLSGAVGATGSHIALDRLYKLLHLCGTYLEGGILQKKSPKELSEEAAIWYVREKRTLFYILNCHIACKHYSLAIELLEKAISYYETHQEKDQDNFATLLSLLGCLYLQSGMIPFAEKAFQRVTEIHKQNQGSVPITIRVRMNSGYLKFAQGKQAEAIKEFEYVLDNLDPLNVLAANNRAVCLLYSRNLVQAITSLEEFIRSDPHKTLDETLVYNLSTLYDLESENSGNKKKVIMMMINRFAGDDFPTSALKLI